jgi:hypothetical protein
MPFKCSQESSIGPHYDAQGRLKVFFDKKPCPLKANGSDVDDAAIVAALMPTDEEAGMRKVVPDPFKEAADLALAEAITADLSEQMHRLATDADRMEQEELRALGMPTDEEIMATVRGRR